ncbi:MAG: hypothetical protein O7J95_17145 [Planctomycetota bacterium]|nr:hypothetical protein [Planctomycetota bacterium]
MNQERIAVQPESIAEEPRREDSGSEQTLRLREVLSKTGAAELTRQSFAELAEAVYAGKKGPDELRKLLEDWDNVSASMASKTDAGVLRGYCY